MASPLVQYNPFFALQLGYYDGPTTVGELRQHGDFAIGAMNAIDGEMVGADGAFFQIGVDGTLHEASDDRQLPWAMVTRFAPVEEVMRLPENLDYAGLRSLLDGLTRWNNLYLAFRIEGFATTVNARSLPRQTRPYPPLAQVVKTSYELNEVPIVGVGFRSPPYVGTIDPAGYHLHVMTADRARGGHVNDFVLRDGTLRVAPIRDFQLRLPHESGFDGAPASVVGTWQLVEAWDIGDDPKQPDKKTWPWGDPASGYWVYDSSGNFGLQILEEPAAPHPRRPTGPGLDHPDHPLRAAPGDADPRRLLCVLRHLHRRRRSGDHHPSGRRRRAPAVHRHRPGAPVSPRRRRPPHRQREDVPAAPRSPHLRDWGAGRPDGRQARADGTRLRRCGTAPLHPPTMARRRPARSGPRPTRAGSRLRGS